MERYTIVSDMDVPVWLRRTAWGIADDLAELLGLPLAMEFVRASRPGEPEDYVSPVPIRGGAQPRRGVVVLRADLPWNGAQLEQTICHEVAHIVIDQLGREQDEERADLLAGYLGRELWKHRIRKLCYRRARLLTTRARAQGRTAPAWARNFPAIEFRGMGV
ncbi:MAG: hypothetical protein RMJ05_07920 [Thermomicrobium sp.]|nr:hypothetical protein [Thermomicrobium sp.]MDW8006634.1 hypothetical protein [Thermomicrobium sp.]